MKLIADSGSTKTEWVVLKEKQQVNHCVTRGYNPNYFPKSVLQSGITVTLLPLIDAESVHEIYFYGSGCSTKANNTTVKEVLFECFPNAEIFVEHDLLGAARGLCGHNAGIACIMGTGSNSCYYDGKSVIENVESVGWMFGDKGSGTHIGKLFIEAFLKSECPKHLAEKFTETTGFEFENILTRIYKDNEPQLLFSQTSLFVGKNIDDPFIENIVRQSIREFFEENVCKYQLAHQLPINCTGSIAQVFEDFTRDEAKKLNLMIGNIIQKPMDGLIQYHL
ncbi:MAG: BadF/BadG/BcrA/BcrD ATPase family protein [Bacteroidales bacterium]|nr:BadF/BadG/BcrA/BcrD ATPase family protein [Bacteroidales bacterium]